MDTVFLKGITKATKKEHVNRPRVGMGLQIFFPFRLFELMKSAGQVLASTPGQQKN